MVRNTRAGEAALLPEWVLENKRFVRRSGRGSKPYLVVAKQSSLKDGPLEDVPSFEQTSVGHELVKTRPIVSSDERDVPDKVFIELVELLRGDLHPFVFGPAEGLTFNARNMGVLYLKPYEVTRERTALRITVASHLLSVTKMEFRVEDRLLQQPG